MGKASYSINPLNKSSRGQSVTRDAVCPILNSVTFKFVSAGQRFIRQGEPGNAFYVIQQGTCVVRVEKDGELSVVARLREGDIVGEMAILTGEPRSAHVDAETDMHLWRLTKAQFDRISKRYQNIAEVISDLKSLAGEVGLNYDAVSSPNQKAAKLFLLYRDEHKDILKNEMKEFCSKIQKMGVICKSTDFNDI